MEQLTFPAIKAPPRFFARLLYSSPVRARLQLSSRKLFLRGKGRLLLPPTLPPPLPPARFRHVPSSSGRPANFRKRRRTSRKSLRSAGDLEDALRQLSPCCNVDDDGQRDSQCHPCCNYSLFEPRVILGTFPRSLQKSGGGSGCVRPAKDASAKRKLTRAAARVACSDDDERRTLWYA